MGIDPKSEAHRKKFSEFYNRLLFTGSDDVIRKAIAWKQEIDSEGGTGALNAPSLKSLLDAMRKDLGISKAPVLENSTFTPVGWK